MTTTSTPVPRRRPTAGGEGRKGVGRSSRATERIESLNACLDMPPVGRRGGCNSCSVDDDDVQKPAGLGPLHYCVGFGASPYRRPRALLLGTFLLGTIVLFYFVTNAAEGDASSSSLLLSGTSAALRTKKATVTIPENAVVIRRSVPGATIQLHLRIPTTDGNESRIRSPASESSPVTASLGLHAMTVHVTDPRRCPSPALAVRVAGDALVAVRLTETEPSTVWSGAFRLPRNGTYTLDVRWYGCNWGEGRTAESSSTAYETLDPPVRFAAIDDGSVDAVTAPMSTTHPPLFATTAAWMRTSSIPAYVKLADELMTSSSSPFPLPPYLWMNYKSDPMAGNLLRTSHPFNGSYVSTEGTLKHPDDYYKFADVSNYELVCMLGSETMYDTWTAFMDLRPYIFPGQRPFKFHYYNATSFTRPDRNWDDETKKRIRKCKHVFVSIDESTEPVPQRQYIDQVRTFARHMTAVLRNETSFPIWFLSVSESPATATNCLPPLVLPRSTDHPCNDALRHVFDNVDDKSHNSKDILPPNVHWMDNTDLSLPLWDDDEHHGDSNGRSRRRADVLAVIAYRIYVVVGKGVADWRAAGQFGDIKGLHRNGTLEPNFVLEPYVGW